MNQPAELLRLGGTVRRVREQQQLSIAELAIRTGVDTHRIKDLEAGRLDPTYDVLIALADGLGVWLSALVPGSHEGR
jgi:transcriptional regulator with XRE-family HTH domain